MQNIDETIWDVVVIGGGASGMMSVAIASEKGKKVLLIEKNDTLGKKLLITGGGRCNVTNNEPDVRKFLSKYKDSDKFLFSAFSQFAVEDTINFFKTRGVETKVEALGRVFPTTNSAKTIWEALVKGLNKVTILSSSPVISLNKNDNKIESITLKNNKVIKGKSFILSTGGKSHPETGSTGDGFKWLKDLGHEVSDPTASLVPLNIKDTWVPKLQGVSIEDVKITVLQNNEKQEQKRGKILFTHFGVSGPTVLNLASEVGELLKYGEVFLSLDLLPNLDHGQLNQKLQDIISENSNKKYKNILDNLLPSAVASVIVELSHIDPDKKSNSITREERLGLIELIKNLKIEVDSLLGEDKAIVTSGGVSLEEVDFKTMASKLYPNLYLTGDILDIDRPSGGYSLQLCWTTGFIAGKTA
ncbi:MAG: Flavoprotein family protein [Parcubacteria bacterium C7867-003]|nr:MAG: Flavoprotein family protein [Parcubacteria bacterium C7867-003]